MKYLKLAVRRLVFCCLLLLAVVGIGLVGGIPVPFTDRRSQTADTAIELVEGEDAREDPDEADTKIG